MVEEEELLLRGKALKILCSHEVVLAPVVGG
jgi:hypothetical protein